MIINLALWLCGVDDHLSSPDSVHLLDEVCISISTVRLLNCGLIKGALGLLNESSWTLCLRTEDLQQSFAIFDEIEG